MSQGEAEVRAQEERGGTGKPSGKAPGLPPPELLLSSLLYVVVLGAAPQTEVSSAFKESLNTTG